MCLQDQFTGRYHCNHIGQNQQQQAELQRHIRNGYNHWVLLLVHLQLVVGRGARKAQSGQRHMVLHMMRRHWGSHSHSG